MVSTLRYDYTSMLAETVGKEGITKEELREIEVRAHAIHAKIESDRTDGTLGFTRLPYTHEDAQTFTALAGELANAFDHFVVVGIGGSALGARALHAAFTPGIYGHLLPRLEGAMRVSFLGANTDPSELHDFLAATDLKRTVFNVISKSGDTIEPISVFLYIRKLVIDAVGEEAHRNHFVMATDAKKGTMRAIVDREGYRSVIIPDDVGGRFSVLTSVGLLPAAAMSIEIERLLNGAAAMDERIKSTAELAANPALLYATLQYLAAARHGKTISVLMPYAAHLKEFGFWYRQLWAESLGKRLSRTGEVVHVGPTPIAALGPTDQHSQIQLYNEGPFDKTITFIRVEKFDQDAEVPHLYPDLDGVSYLGRHSFNEIINIEQAATALALTQNRRPNGTIIVPALTPETVGELLYFFEMVTVYCAEYFDINAFDQPGVEAGKEAMYALLGRKGFEERRRQIEEKLNQQSKYTV